MQLRKIHNASDLKKAIEELELRKENEEELLRLHFHEVLEKIKPANLVKETVAEVSESMDFKKNLTNVALGIGVSYLSKKLFVGKKTSGIAKQLLGTALEFGISNLVAKKSQDMLDTAKPKKGFFGRVFARL
jgi:hypothetical protein